MGAKGRFPELGKRLRMQSLLLLAGCALASAAPAQEHSPVRSLLEIRRANVIVQKWDVSCGAAALATLLTYQHADPVDEETVARGMLRRTDPLRVKFRGGFSLLDLKRYADGRGFKANAYRSLQMEDLERFAPAIVPINAHGYPHFVIFRGRMAGSVLLADPAFGNRVINVEQFERIWQQNIAFVIGRSDEKPAPSKLGIQESDFLRTPEVVVRGVLR
jgi:predicted double-glycine peptidase